MKRKAYEKLLLAFLSMGITTSLLLQGCGNTVKQASSPFSDAKPKETTDGVMKEDEIVRDSVDATDTVRWINASYAILTEINGQDYSMFGGMEATQANKIMEVASLEEWWDVTDRKSADETLDWVLTEGHRTDFLETVGIMEECGFSELTPQEREQVLVEDFELDEDSASIYANYYKMYEQYGTTAIDAWDYCRGMNLCGFYYIAGYYTKEEALDKALEIANTTQSRFGSWDDLVDSYLRGYEYWMDEDSAERRGIYEDLCAREDNPYAVDYHTVLTKEW